MQRIHQDETYFPIINPDLQSYQSILNLYGKRCRLLVLLGSPPETDGVHFRRIRRGIRWSDTDTVTTLGECRTTKDCVVATQRIMHEMKSDPTCPNPSMTHYSALLFIDDVLRGWIEYWHGR
jgi:hypothetical protein